jgi:hypothetical protein
MKLVHGTWIGLIAALAVAPLAAQQKPAKPSRSPSPPRPTPMPAPGPRGSAS